MLTPFIAYLDGWRSGEVLLLIVDNEGVEWLMSRFEHLGADGLDESNGAEFVLGDSNPVESDGRCLVRVELNHKSNDSRITRVSQSAWLWSVSRSAADIFRARLSGMSLEHACHQYLDSDEGPAVEVSIGEYEIDIVRRWAASS
jgi:hypothetical protein